MDWTDSVPVPRDPANPERTALNNGPRPQRPRRLLLSIPCMRRVATASSAAVIAAKRSLLRGGNANWHRELVIVRAGLTLGPISIMDVQCITT